MTESQIKSVALFFFFSLIDEDQAERATHMALERCRSRLKNVEKRSQDPQTVIIHQCFLIWQKFQEHHGSHKSMHGQKTKFITPSNISFGAWRQFHKEASSEELIAVIWSRVLGVDDAHVAQGLGVTAGTVRYRVGRGLRQLGHLITLGELRA